MQLIQTKKFVNMSEIDVIAAFAAEANNNPELNWNKVLEKINRDRSIAGIPSLRQRCFIAIMKSGGASDGRIRGWSKRKYLKNIGYKEQNEDFQKKLQEGLKSICPATEVPQEETPVVENVEPESSIEAEEASKLSCDAIALLKFFINHNIDRKINVSAAKKFFGIGMKRIYDAEEELLNLQIIRCEGPLHKKGTRYVLTLDNEMINAMYPQTNGVCLVSDMPMSKKNRYNKSSEKVEDEKDCFQPQTKLQDAVCLIRTNSEKGIPYRNCEEFSKILPDGNWKKWNEIQKMLEELDILVRVGKNGDEWFFQDPENNSYVHNDPITNNKVVEPEVVKDDDVQQITVIQNETPKTSCLTEDEADSITVNCHRKDVKYRVMKSNNGYVIDIM